MYKGKSTRSESLAPTKIDSLKIMMMLELEDPYDEEERFLNRPQPTKARLHKNAQPKHSPLPGRTNRAVYAILLTGFVSITVIGSLFYSGQNNSPPDTIQKSSRGDTTIPEVHNESTKEIEDTNTASTVIGNGTAEAIPQQFAEPRNNIHRGKNIPVVTLPTESDASSTSKATAKESVSTKQTKHSMLSDFGSDEFLRQADVVVQRAMSAILDEYGQDPMEDYFAKHSSSNNTANTASTKSIFAWDKINLTTATEAPGAFQKRGNRGNGGWTSPQSWKGLVLRLVQALSQQSEFTVVLAGHSAAAGHGNHFHQSYLMQFHKVMAPVLRQLGVTLTSRNQAQGGLGTVQSSLGFNSIYGSDIDLILWDSGKNEKMVCKKPRFSCCCDSPKYCLPGMTENNNPAHIDLFFRQALMTEGRLPVVWSAGGKFDLLKIFYNEADADIGEYGLGWDGIPETTDEAQVETLPWATQHLKCNEERPELCRHPYKFCATCWIDRPDKIHPTQTQYDQPHGQVKWHPGWRRHQLQGRVLAFAILQALRDAVSMLRNDGSSSIPNMTDYYDNIRTKMKALDPSLGLCYQLNASIPGRICRTPMKGRTQYTPRANPMETSVSSLLKAAPPDSYRPRNSLTVLYNGPDAHNPCFDLPEGAVDVVARINQNATLPESRRRILEDDDSISTATPLSTATRSTIVSEDPSTIMNDTEMIVPGRGWQIVDEPQGVCDGTYDSVCAKSTRNRCVLYGHHDERGAVLGSEMAGWLVMQIPREELQAGILMLKLHTWYDANDNWRTAGWKTVNNVDPTEAGSDSNRLVEDDEDLTLETDEDVKSNATDPTDRRNLKKRMYVTPDLNQQFQFEFAIDGVITSWNKTEFLAQKQDIQRMVEIVTLLDDETFATTSQRSGGSGEEGNMVEVAIRLRGCNHRCFFGVSHVYWA